VNRYTETAYFMQKDSRKFGTLYYSLYLCRQEETVKKTYCNIILQMNIKIPFLKNLPPQQLTVTGGKSFYLDIMTLIFLWITVYLFAVCLNPVSSADHGCHLHSPTSISENCAVNEWSTGLAAYIPNEISPSPLSKWNVRIW